MVQCVEVAVKAVDKLGLNTDKEVQAYIRIIKYEIECGKLNCAYMSRLEKVPPKQRDTSKCLQFKTKKQKNRALLCEFYSKK